MISKSFATALTVMLLCGNAYAQRINIAAIVNDEVITTTDVAERRDLVMASNNIPPTIENQKRITPRVIQSLIDENLQMQEARRLSVAVKKEELATALAQVEESRRMPRGSLREMFEKQGLSVRSLEAQLTAQIAWNKVVQRKLRRSVSISEDEVARAQASQAADPGVPEVRIAAISLLVRKPEMEAPQGELAKQLATQLQQGTDFLTLAGQLAGREDVRISPPGWVEEERLQPAMQQALRTMQPGQVSLPLKSMNTFQLVQLLERRTAKKVPDSTEVVIKEMLLPLPPKPDQKTMLALRDTARAVHQNPGGCMEETMGVPVTGGKVRYLRTVLGGLPAELRGIIAHMGVTEVSEPMISDEAVRLFMLCERIEPSAGNLPPAADVRRELFNEKIELEAQKHLRNLKRDAFIDIKGEPKAADAQ